MRIAVVGPLRLPNPHGGMSRHVEEVGARLVGAGHEVTVFVAREPDRRHHRGIRLRGVPVVARYGWDRLAYSLAASLAAAAGRFDVVHYHSLAVAGFSFVPRAARKPVVLTIHRFEWQDAKWGRLQRAYLRYCESVAMRCAGVRLAVSEAFATELAERHPTLGPVTTIRNGVTLPEGTDPRALERLGLADDGYLLCVGRLVPEKGFDVAVDAVAQLEPAVGGHAPVLALVGGARERGGYADALRARAAALGDRARLLGTQPAETLATLYSHARAFVAPFFHEGQPLTVLEAMAYGCPVVASDIPAHREILGGAARYFPPGDSSALAGALRELLTDPACAHDLGARGRRRLEDGDGYSWTATARATEEALASAARSSGTSRFARAAGGRRRAAARDVWHAARLARRRPSAERRALPDFLILGAQKAGTSTLYARLASHPQVEPAVWKEVHYFDSRRADQGVKGVAWYRAHFPLTAPNIVTGEASPFYLAHPTAPERARRLVPGAKLVAVLRDPVERAVSGYHHAVRMGFEDRPPTVALDPDAADAVPAGAGASWWDRADCPVRLRGYHIRGHYAEQLERWFDAFGRDAVLVLETTQLRDGSALTETVRFLGLDDADLPPVADRNVQRYEAPPEEVVKVLADYYAPHNARLFTLLGTSWPWKA